MSVRRIILVALALALVVAAPDVFAQAVDGTEERFRGILDTFQQQSRLWQSALFRSAQWLFFSLALISLTWTNMGLALRGGYIGEFIEANSKWLLATGFMWLWLIHGYDWSLAIIQSFRQAGEKAVLVSAPGAAAALDPAHVLQNGMVVAGAIFSKMGSLTSGLLAVPLFLCAIGLLACFALIAAFMAKAIVESYIVIGGSTLLLGFGGSPWTKDIAVKTIFYSLSVGAKLFVMQLIVGMAMGTVLQWAATSDPDSITEIGSLLGVCILIVVLAKGIPDIVQGFIAGASPGGTGNLLATAAAGAAALASGGAAIAATGALGSAAASAAAASGGVAPVGAAAVSGATRAAAVGVHLGRAMGHTVTAGSNVDVGRAMGPLGAVARGAALSADPKPTPPVLGGSGSDGSAPAAASAAPASSDAAPPEGGVIRGSAPSAPPPSSATPSSPSPTAPSTPGSGSVFSTALKAGGAIGLAVAGPGGALIGAAAGAVAKPYLDRASARASAALASARKQFGLPPQTDTPLSDSLRGNRPNP